MDLNLSLTWPEYAQAVMGLLAIVNPLSTIPLFLGLTPGASRAERRGIASRTALTTLIIIMIVYLSGEWILRFFSISIASFRIAGGLLIALVASSMLQAKQSSVRQTAEEAEEPQGRSSIAIVPLSLPSMAGPGTISMVIVASGQTATMHDHLAFIAGALVVGLVIWVVLGSSSVLAKALGQTGMNIMTRIMGLILLAIAVEFVLRGLAEKFPGWLN